MLYCVESKGGYTAGLHIEMVFCTRMRSLIWVKNSYHNVMPTRNESQIGLLGLIFENVLDCCNMIFLGTYVAKDS